jgi:hypothetical protein
MDHDENAKFHVMVQIFERIHGAHNGRAFMKWYIESFCDGIHDWFAFRDLLVPATEP